MSSSESSRLTTLRANRLPPRVRSAIWRMVLPAPVPSGPTTRYSISLNLGVPDAFDIRSLGLFGDGRRGLINLGEPGRGRGEGCLLRELSPGLPSRQYPQDSGC